MNNITKKSFSFFLSMMLLITMAIPAITLTTSADDSGEKTEGDFSYYAYGGTANISRYTGTASEVVIPSTIGGYPVNEIGSNVFYGKASIKKVTVSEGIKKIFEQAFIGCTGLTEVSVPSSVNYIYMNAFSGCINLSAINVDNGNITYASVEGVLFSKDLKELITYPNAKSDTYIIPEGVTTVNQDAFNNCTNLTGITFSDSVTEIMFGAFQGCSGLTDITLGNNVTSICGMSFEGCTGLTKIIIPGTVKNIDYAAFEKCTSLADITIPDSVETIGAAAFDETPWYNNQPQGLIYIQNIAYKWKGDMPDNTEIIFKDGTKSITNLAFYNYDNLINVTIPDSLTVIGDGAFSCCSQLKNVIIGNGVTLIGDSAFCNCVELTNITIPDSVITIRNSAFGYCNKLESVIIGNNVQEIYDNAFHDCTNLTNLTMGNNVNFIGYYAFSNCSKLAEIILPDSIKLIGGYAFEKTAWYESQPDGLVYAGKVLYDWKGKMPENTKLTIKEGTKVICINSLSGLEGLISVTIPESVEYINNYAFSDCPKLTSIDLPDNLISIGYAAFIRTGILSINIPDTVTYIGDRSIGFIMEGGGVTGPDSRIIDFIITGTKGSAAEIYAKKYGFMFLNSNTDLNGDGKMTAADALIVLQCSVNKITLNDDQKMLADINCDNNITASDALLILQCAVGKINLG